MKTRLGALAHAAVLCALLCSVVATSTASAAPKAPRTYTKPIEALSSYQGQRICSPTAKPGVTAFKNIVLAAYPGTRHLGIVRACGAGGRSEHKEGRAFDWGVNVARPGERAAAADLIRWLHATDRYGNRYANARRLGIQYVIWNRRIWSSYAPTWRAYGGPSPHTDHMHVSFNWPGARKQTSFWDGSVANAGPGTMPSAPAAPRPVAPPRQPAPNAAPPVRDTQAWRVDPRRPAGSSSPGSIRAGQRYVLTVSGTYGAGKGAYADAECWRANGSTAWLRRGPAGDAGDALVNGRDVDLRPVAPARTGDRGCDTSTHGYTAVVQPSRTGVVNVRVKDTGYSDNSGVLIARLTPWQAPKEEDERDEDEDEEEPQQEEAAPLPPVPAAPAIEKVFVSATSGTGVSTSKTYAAGTTVVLRASGTYVFGPRPMVADAECSVWPSDGQWRATSERDPEGAGHLDVTVNGKLLPWTPFTTTGGECDRGHEYFLRATVGKTGRLRIAIEDDNYRDNSGGLTVTVEEVR